jgi:hypothetical protein
MGYLKSCHRDHDGSFYEVVGDNKFNMDMVKAAAQI